MTIYQMNIGQCSKKKKLAIALALIVVPGSGIAIGLWFLFRIINRPNKKAPGDAGQS